MIADVLIDSIWRGLRLHGALVRQWTTENHKPLVRPRPFPLQTRLYVAFNHLDFHGAFLTIAHCQASPGRRAERLAPHTHRLPRGLGAASTPVIGGQRGLQITNGGGAGHPEHIPLAPLPQRLTKPRVDPAHRPPSPSRAAPAPPTGRASPGTARAASDTAPPAGHGTPHAVAYLGPSPRERTSGSRVRHSRDARRTP